MNSLMEVSDTQAAAALLGMSAGICSENFSYFDTTGHLAYVWEEKHGSEEMSFCSDLSCEDEDEDNLQSFISKSSLSQATLLECDENSVISSIGSACFSNLVGSDQLENESRDPLNAQVENQTVDLVVKLAMDANDKNNNVVQQEKLSCPFQNFDAPCKSNTVYWIDHGKVPVCVPSPLLYRH